MCSKTVEIGIDSPLTKCFLDDSAMAPGETVVLQVFSRHKQAVIQREANLLTKKELAEHADLANAAILEELRIWHKHSCFRRRRRSDCHNIMDSRFVARWKIITENGTRKRLLRMRRRWPAACQYRILLEYFSCCQGSVVMAPTPCSASPAAAVTACDVIAI